MRFPPASRIWRFRVSVPSDWTSHDLPADDVDFSEPTAFVPLVKVGERIRGVEQSPDGSRWMLEHANPGELIHVTPK